MDSEPTVQNGIEPSVGNGFGLMHNIDGEFRSQSIATPDTPLLSVNPNNSLEESGFFSAPSSSVESAHAITVSAPSQGHPKLPRIEIVEMAEDEPMEVVQHKHNGTTAAVDYFATKTFVELGRCTWTGRRSNQRYLKGVIWSPDGTCMLTVVNGDGMHVIELPSDLYAVGAVNDDRQINILESAVHVAEGGLVYDYRWYPNMSSQDPTTCW